MPVRMPSYILDITYNHINVHLVNLFYFHLLVCTVHQAIYVPYREIREVRWVLQDILHNSH